MRSKIFTACSLMLLSGCAYYTDTALQDVRIETPGAYNAWCIADVQGFRYKFNPPETINIRNSPDDMIVECVAPGNRQRTIVVPPRDNDTTMLNLVNGYIPGLAVDHYSGAAYQYPDLILVDFTGIESQPEAMPAQNAPDVIQPEEYDLEEFLPSQPRLNSDRYAVPSEIKKRERKRQSFYDTNAFGRALAVTPQIDPNTLNPEGANAPANEDGMAAETNEQSSAEQQELINMADPSGAESAPSSADDFSDSDDLMGTLDPMALDPSSPPPETGAVTTVPAENDPSPAPEATTPPEAAPAPPQPATTTIPQPVTPPLAAPATEGPVPVAPPQETERAPFPPPEFLEKSKSSPAPSPAPSANTGVPKPVAPAQTNL